MPNERTTPHNTVGAAVLQIPSFTVDGGWQRMDGAENKLNKHQPDDTSAHHLKEKAVDWKTKTSHHLTVDCHPLVMHRKHPVCHSTSETVSTRMFARTSECVCVFLYVYPYVCIFAYSRLKINACCVSLAMDAMPAWTVTGGKSWETDKALSNRALPVRQNEPDRSVFFCGYLRLWKRVRGRNKVKVRERVRAALRWRRNTQKMNETWLEFVRRKKCVCLFHSSHVK